MTSIKPKSKKDDWNLKYSVNRNIEHDIDKSIGWIF